MSKRNKAAGTSAVTAQDVKEAAETQREAASGNNFAQAAEKLEAAGIEPVAPIETKTTNKRGVLPDALGNNVKGERICSVCGIKESETLAKNPRYSFCKGKCINCYGKTERKTKQADLTVEQIEAKIKHFTELLAKKQGLSQGTAIENVDATKPSIAIETHGANVGIKVDAADELAVIE